MKRPSFQFYPSDWLRDTALRTCSVGARGLWIDMICYMHEGNPYGVLKVGNKVILAPNLAAMIGATLEDTEGWLVELESAGVFDRGENGEIMSRRMIRDENLRNIRASGGKLGGNPAFLKDKVTSKVNLADNLVGKSKVNQKPTPSSSSSSSSSTSSSTIIPKTNNKDKATIDELRVFCKSLQLEESDGDWVFDKWEGNGWKNDGKLIVSWQSTIRSWKRIGTIFPSQKAKQSKPTTTHHDRHANDPEGAVIDFEFAYTK